MLECLRAGMLECLRAGMLECLRAGMLKGLYGLKGWKVGVLELRSELNHPAHILAFTN